MYEYIIIRIMNILWNSTIIYLFELHFLSILLSDSRGIHTSHFNSGGLRMRIFIHRHRIRMV